MRNTSKSAMPKVTRAAFLAASLLTANLASASLIQNVVETGGTTGVPAAQWSGMTFSNTNPGFIATVGLFGEDALSNTDRGHQWNGITNSAGTPMTLPSYLVGSEYMVLGQNNRDKTNYVLDVTLTSPAKVYLLIDNRLGDANGANPPNFATNMTWVVNNGFTPIKTGYNRAQNDTLVDEIGVDETGYQDNTRGPGVGLNQFASVYEKDFGAGTFSLFQANNGGQNMYGVVVAAIPEPGTVTLLGLGIAGLVAMRLRKQRR